MVWKARAHDGRYFRRASPAEKAILDQARADLLRGWDTNDDNLKTSAYLTLRKTLEPMRIPGALTEKMRYARKKRFNAKR
jgi:hypothetical protein